MSARGVAAIMCALVAPIVTHYSATAGALMFVTCTVALLLWLGESR